MKVLLGTGCLNASNALKRDGVCDWVAEREIRKSELDFRKFPPNIFHENKPIVFLNKNEICNLI
ncbi:MAG: hypothetical protein ACTSYI_16720 [Promethearchaeota archaeon]